MRDWLRGLRLAKNLTQQQIAEILLVSDVAVTHWESGTRRPSYDRILMLADLLGPEVLVNFAAEARAKHQAEGVA